MYIKNPEIEIDPDVPFKSDRLSRFESAQILTELLRSLDEPFVLSIDSGWGTGKTTFVRMWGQHLKNEGFPCLYFNAWEHDFYYDPLIPFIGAMQSAIVSALGDERPKAREYFEKAKNIGGALVRRAIPAAVKIATAGVLDLEEVTEGVLADLAAEYAQERIDSYEADKKTLEEFRENLKGFAAELSEGGEKPLIFFIDELDRCRPTYAIELLERVKHLFNVPGIVFVLVLDKDQLAHSVKALYGTGMKVDGYLRRFIDLEYQLPEASSEDFCDYLLSQFGFEEFFGNRRGGDREKWDFLETFVKLSEVFGFSLRVQEQCFTRLSIVFRTTPPIRYPLFPPFLAFLIAFRAANRSLYNRFVAGEVSSQDVIGFIKEQPIGEDFMDEAHGVHVEAYLLSAHCRPGDLSHLIDGYYAKLEDDSVSKEQRHRYDTILGILKDLDRHRICPVVSYLAQKIEISERFTEAA
jgi:hypothetical protein